jgi:hypothetical protein
MEIVFVAEQSDIGPVTVNVIDCAPAVVSVGVVSVVDVESSLCCPSSDVSVPDPLA